MDFATQQELRRGKAEERFLELRRSELEAEGGVFGKERLTLASFDGVKMSYTIEDVRRGYRAVGNSAKKIINNFLAGASLKNDQAAVEMMLEQIIAEESSPDALAQEVSARLERLQISETKVSAAARVEEEEEIECAICLESGGALFAAPCDPRHQFHLPCLTVHYRRNRKLVKCPTCRALWIRQAVPDQSPVYSQDTAFEPQPPTFDCSFCESSFEGSDPVCCCLCEKEVCQLCMLVREYEGGVESDVYCPRCLKFFSNLARAHDKKISENLSTATRKECGICEKVTCSSCEIDNGDVSYCVSCVAENASIYVEMKREVEDRFKSK